MAELRHVLETGIGTIAVSGCRGIGKSFVARAVVKDYLADTDGIGIYLGQGSERAARRSVAVYVPRLEEWIDALTAIQLGSEIQLPGKLTLPMLLAPPRQWAKTLKKLHADGDRVVIIIDQHELDSSERGYTREDLEALAAMRAGGIQIVAELARPKAAGEEVDSVEAKLLKDYVPVRLRCPTGPEARALARFVVERELAVAVVDHDAIQAYAGVVVALVGTHPGSIVALIEEAAALLKSRGGEGVFEGSGGSLFAAACKESAFQKYLSARWAGLTNAEEITACLIAIAESSRTPFREVLKWWSGALGKTEGEEVTHMDTAEFMQDSDCLIEGGRDDPRISGTAVREFINKTSRARELRAKMGVVLPEQPSFDFSRFLRLWLFAIGWYFVASIILWILEAVDVRIHGHTLIVPVVLLAGVILPGWWVARHYLGKRQKRSS